MGRSVMAKNSEDAQLGQRLAVRAAGHFLAAETLFHADPENSFNGRFSASIWLLLGFSLELAMKAVIAASGGNEDELRTLGHDLEKLLERVEPIMGPLPDLAAFAIRSLALTHRKNWMRYGGAREIDLPQLPVTLTTARTIVDRAMRDVGLHPDGA